MQGLHRNLANQHVAPLVVRREVLMQRAAEVRKRHGYGIVSQSEQRERKFHVATAGSVLGLEIPFSEIRFHLRPPAVADRALWRDRIAGRLVKTDGLPLGAVRLPQLVGEI